VGTISESAIAIPVLCIYSIGGIYYYGHGLVSKSELFQARQIASADAITTAVARASFPTRHAAPVQHGWGAVSFPGSAMIEKRISYAGRADWVLRASR